MVSMSLVMGGWSKVLFLSCYTTDLRQRSMELAPIVSRRGVFVVGRMALQIDPAFKSPITFSLVGKGLTLRTKRPYNRIIPDQDRCLFEPIGGLVDGSSQRSGGQRW